MQTELYKRYRPKKLEQVIGQASAISVLNKFVAKGNIPHAILFSGPSGVGKTTIARILRKPLKCHASELIEMNIADIRGVDNIRDIRRKMGLRPMLGDSRIYVLDEAGAMTKDAQQALLKMLEDTPEHVWFILCTTDPHKLIKTIRTRCTEIALKPIGEKDLAELVMSVYHQEVKEGPFPETAIDKIVENSDGSARKALVILESILEMDNEAEMLDAIDKMNQEKQTIDLCRLLLNPRSQWAEVATILKDLEGEEPENARRCILGYMRAVLLKSAMPRAYQILGAFERNFFDSGNAGLAMVCYEVMRK